MNFQDRPFHERRWPWTLEAWRIKSQQKSNQRTPFRGSKPWGRRARAQDLASAQKSAYRALSTCPETTGENCVYVCVLDGFFPPTDDSLAPSPHLCSQTNLLMWSALC